MIVLRELRNILREDSGRHIKDHGFYREDALWIDKLNSSQVSEQIVWSIWLIRLLTFVKRW